MPTTTPTDICDPPVRLISVPSVPYVGPDAVGPKYRRGRSCRRSRSESPRARRDDIRARRSSTTRRPRQRSLIDCRSVQLTASAAPCDVIRHVTGDPRMRDVIHFASSSLTHDCSVPVSTVVQRSMGSVQLPEYGAGQQKAFQYTTSEI